MENVALSLTLIPNLGFATDCKEKRQNGWRDAVWRFLSPLRDVIFRFFAIVVVILFSL